MRMRFLGLMALAIPATALAQQGQGDVSVTIYNSDLALIQDQRMINLPAGRQRVEFPDVSGRIRPETVTLSADDAGIIEQNFDFDLLTPAKLMEEAVGETVTLVRTNPATGAETRERATILAVNNGVVMQIGPRIEILRDDQLPVRVIFDTVPPNLRARPTLSVTLDSDRAGSRPATLTYLTSGMGWNADYVALFDENSGTIDVQGWITLTNTTGTTFENADTVLVAGEPNQSNRYQGGRGTPNSQVRRAGTESAEREMVGDFYLYPLAERTTIADRQTKQVSFLDVTGAPARRGYAYRVGWMQTEEEPRPVDSMLEFSSSRSGGLGDALPAGTVRVYVRDSEGQPQFTGESGIDHTPMGSDLALVTGQAFDIQVQPVVERRDRITEAQWIEMSRFKIWDGENTRSGSSSWLSRSSYWRTEMSYTLSNARNRPVTVDLRQDGLGRWWLATRLISSTHDTEWRRESAVMWRVTVPANGETVVRATFDTRF